MRTALRRELGPYAARLHDALAVARWYRVAAALIPGYVPTKEERHV